MSNLTGLHATTGTYLESFPTGSPSNPPTSDVNYDPGAVQPNLVITKVDPATRSITICNSAGFTDLFVDLGGVYRQ